MSFAGACREKGHHHVILTRHGNYSAFNGYRFERSAYSSIRCLETLAVWRTKGAYADSLPDATEAEARNPHKTPEHEAHRALASGRRFNL